MHIVVRSVDFTTVLQPGSIISWLLVGLIAGALAGYIVRGRGFGCLGDIVVGLIGSFIGSIVASALDITGTFRFCGSVFISLIGAIILVAVLELLTGGFSRRWR